MGGLTLVSDLYCPNCGGIAPQQVKYVAGMLHRVDCQRCGRGWDVGHRWLWYHYLRHWPRRLISKPARLANEARRHPLAFALGFPVRVVSKPIRVASEMGTIVGVFGE